MNKLTNIVSGIALAGTLASGAVAQDAGNSGELPEWPGVDTKLTLRNATEGIGSDNVSWIQQGILNCDLNTASDLSFKLVYENDNGSGNFGAILSNDFFNVDVAYSEVSGGRDEIGIEGILRGENGFFVGGSYSNEGEGRGTFLAGTDITDKLSVQGNFSTNGDWRAVGLYDFGDFNLGAGVGQSGEDTVASLSVNNDDVWAYARLRPELEVGLLFGDVKGQTAPFEISDLFSGVSGYGIHQDHGGNALLFDIGDFTVLSDVPGAFLGSNAGDVGASFNYRADEDGRLRGRFYERIGDVGFLENAYFGGEARHFLDNGEWGASLEAGGDISSNFGIRARLNYDSDIGVTAGIFGEIRFGGK